MPCPQRGRKVTLGRSLAWPADDYTDPRDTDWQLNRLAHGSYKEQSTVGAVFDGEPRYGHPVGRPPASGYTEGLGFQTALDGLWRLRAEREFQHRPRRENRCSAGRAWLAPPHSLVSAYQLGLVQRQR